MTAEPALMESIKSSRRRGAGKYGPKPSHSGAEREPSIPTKLLTARAKPRYRTEILSRWTERNLYFLFVCISYEVLNLKPLPDSLN